MLKRILRGLVVLVAVLLGVGLVLPSTWTVERTVMVKAKPEHILPIIANLERWQDWAAWNKEMDPGATWTYSGAKSGVGATMSWKGEELGTGTLTLTQVDTRRVAYTMVMEGGTPAAGGFTFSADGEGTKVTWKDEGDMGMNLLGRYFVPMMESMLAEHFDQGLVKLKGLAEAAQVEADKVAAETAAKAAAEAAAQAPTEGTAAPAAEGTPAKTAADAP